MGQVWLLEKQIFCNFIHKSLLSHPGTPCHNELRTSDSKFVNGILIVTPKSVIIQGDPKRL